LLHVISNRAGSFTWVAAVWLALCASVVQAQFASQNVTLRSHLDLTDLEANQGNDCWGYTSPSGREYALMGVNDRMIVVEITDPDNPEIIEYRPGTNGVPHTNSTWADIKTYGSYAYVVNECNPADCAGGPSGGGGMDVVDLSDVDNGNITLVQRVTLNGLGTSHNVAIDTDSGFLYLPGSNLNGGAPVVYSLADPANPVEVGRWTELSSAYHHDAHIVTYTSGPYAGRQIEFGFSEGRGLDILDVTDKNDIFLLSRTAYPNLSYCHQGWTTPDRKFLFVNDELDEGSAAVPTTRTLVFDISDLTAPTLASTFTTGAASRDHNLYIRDCVLYESNYSSGLWVFNIADPFNPVGVGFFDTHPENNAVNFDGAWSVYPYFPSGIVIISDIDRGLFVLDVSEALAESDMLGGLTFDYPTGRPESIAADGEDNVTLSVDGACGGVLDTGSVTLHADTGSGFETTTAQEILPGLFEAGLPLGVCGQTIDYYFSADVQGGATFADPPGAPTDVYTTRVADSVEIAVSHDFELDSGWVSGPDTASTGTWVRGDPNGTGAQPEFDTTPDPGTDCLFTQQNATGDLGGGDVHGGTAVVTSPVFDLSDGDAVIQYQRWYFERDEGDDPDDGFLAEISNDGGANWTTIESLSPGDGGWETVELHVSDFVVPTSQMQLRFSATDATADGDIVEAAIDDFTIMRFVCVPQSTDINSDGALNLGDYALMQRCFTSQGACPCVPPAYSGLSDPNCRNADIDLDGDVDNADFSAVAADLDAP